MKSKAIHDMIEDKIGLTYVMSRNTNIGKYHDYTVFVYPDKNSEAQDEQFVVTVFASKDQRPINEADLKLKPMPCIVAHKAEGFAYSLTVNTSLKPNEAVDTIFDVIKAATNTLDYAGYDEDVPESTIDRWARAERNRIPVSLKDLRMPVKTGAKERVALGIIGASLGSLVGFAIIVLLGYSGYISPLAGTIVGILCVLFYTRLAKAFSIKSIIITTLIIVGISYGAFRLGTAFCYLYDNPGSELSLLQCFKDCKKLFPTLDRGNYYYNMLLTLVTGVVGGFLSSYLFTDFYKKQ
ncbi:MAG: hypothetical protein K6F84_05125 [Lachnospiraceae bacterium]|nr:hypothetical protein [Lachnospiraceae bacterium]